MPNKPLFGAGVALPNNPPLEAGTAELPNNPPLGAAEGAPKIEVVAVDVAEGTDDPNPVADELPKPPKPVIAGFEEEEEEAPKRPPPVPLVMEEDPKAGVGALEPKIPPPVVEGAVDDPKSPPPPIEVEDGAPKGLEVGAPKSGAGAGLPKAPAVPNPEDGAEGAAPNVVVGAEEPNAEVVAGAPNVEAVEPKAEVPELGEPNAGVGDPKGVAAGAPNGVDLC